VVNVGANDNKCYNLIVLFVSGDLEHI